MKHFIIHLAVALLTFVVGIAALLIWAALRAQPIKRAEVL